MSESLEHSRDSLNSLDKIDQSQPRLRRQSMHDPQILSTLPSNFSLFGIDNFLQLRELSLQTNF